MPDSTSTKGFKKFSVYTANFAGSPQAFLIALGLIVGWLVTGSYFKWSDSHSFFINNITTVITFLMTFVIQASQNRDSRAMQIKLNEIIRSNTEARNKIIDLEDAEEEEAKLLQKEFKEIREHE